MHRQTAWDSQKLPMEMRWNNDRNPAQAAGGASGRQGVYTYAENKEIKRGPQIRVR